jgi:hypothetical protein
MSDKFTPGPWKWDDDLCDRQWHPLSALEDSEGRSILIHYAQWPMRRADAQLIASAPLLYGALRQLERAFAVGAEGYRAVADRGRALRAARAALRAARGEEA